jgi:electron transport complex protein RnfB
MLTAVAIMGVFAATVGGGLWLASRYLTAEESELLSQVNALLPQTQCAQCGYPGCKPYAKAIVEQNEAINRCPPGGDTTIKALADLLDRDVVSLNPENGEHKPARIAKIIEDQCIGCTLCIQACPVDAIIGGPKQMHTVIDDLCTGCDLCLPPCPVDCIEMVEIPTKKPPIVEMAEQACIRCGDCAPECPAELLPQELYRHIKAGEYDKAEKLDLNKCIECGACDAVCPSHIPLVDYFVEGKWHLGQEIIKAENRQIAQQRYEQRETRIERKQSLIEAKRQAKLAEKSKSDKQALITAAVARAKDKAKAGARER